MYSSICQIIRFILVILLLSFGKTTTIKRVLLCLSHFDIPKVDTFICFTKQLSNYFHVYFKIISSILINPSNYNTYQGKKQNDKNA